MRYRAKICLRGIGPNRIHQAGYVYWVVLMSDRFGLNGFEYADDL